MKTKTHGAQQEVVCGWCKITFSARVADVKRGWGKFCSKSCKASQQEKRTGQSAQFKRNCRELDEERMHHEASAANEAGWDGHKNS